MAKKRVAILGGGIGGLTAAHELCERGYEVTVYEAAPERALGGKARTQWYDPKGINDWPTDRRLPGEHGFRFFPRFYSHVIDTMQRIPHPSLPGLSVADCLCPSTEAGFASVDFGLHVFQKRLPEAPAEMMQALSRTLRAQGASHQDAVRFSLRILLFLTSCEQRRRAEYERMTFWEFIEGDLYSPRFQRYLDATPRTLVAMDSRYGNAWTMCKILVQLLLDLKAPADQSDRVLDGPTSVRWLQPWVRHLKKKGVVFRCNHFLNMRVSRNGNCIHSFSANQVRWKGQTYNPYAAMDGGIVKTPRPILADYFIFAMPMWTLSVIFRESSALATDPALALLMKDFGQKVTDIMTGIQFYLPKYTPIVSGHVFYPDSKYALTSVSQAQFWGGAERFRNEYGSNSVRDILSVDVSNFTTGTTSTPGGVESTVLPAPDDLVKEVWNQLLDALNSRGARILTDYVDYRIDDDLGNHKRRNFNEGGPRVSYSSFSEHPVHPPGFWALRPEAYTALDNLFVATDYVRTTTDLATMEGANEAARRAVNALLDRDRSSAPRCVLFPLREPPEFAPLQRLDEGLYERRAPPLMEVLGLTSAVRTDLQTTLLTLGPGAQSQSERAGASLPRR